MYIDSSDFHAALLGADFIKSATLGFFLNIAGMFFIKVRWSRFICLCARGTTHEPRSV